MWPSISSSFGWNGAVRGRPIPKQHAAGLRVATAILIVCVCARAEGTAPTLVPKETFDCEAKIIGQLLLSAGGDRIAVVADFVTEGEGIKCWNVESGTVSRHYSFADELDGPFHGVTLSKDGGNVFACKLAYSDVFEFSKQGMDRVRLPGQQLVQFRYLFNARDGTPYGMAQLKSGEDLALVNLQNGVTTVYPIAPWDAWGFSGATRIAPTLDAVSCRLDKSDGDATVVAVFSLDGIGPLDRRIRDYEVRLGEHVKYVFPDFSWDGSLLVVGTSRGDLTLHDLKQKKVLWKRHVKCGGLGGQSQLFSSDQRVLAVASGNYLTFIRVADGETIFKLEADHAICVASSPRGNIFATTRGNPGQNKWQLKLWRVE